jgi:hypothetical protein
MRYIKHHKVAVKEWYLLGFTKSNGNNLLAPTEHHATNQRARLLVLVVVLLIGLE